MEGGEMVHGYEEYDVFCPIVLDPEKLRSGQEKSDGHIRWGFNTKRSPKRGGQNQRFRAGRSRCPQYGVKVFSLERDWLFAVERVV